MKISVITVCYNDIDGLNKTLDSYKRLNYTDKEIIVVDGLSTDGSSDLIREKKFIDLAIIEKDDGIYNAMNKGIDSASGDFCIFMNAGDVFSSDNCLDVLLTSNLSRQDLVYGDVYVDSINNEQLISANNICNLWKGMCFSHQSLFARTKLLKEIKFDESMEIAADYDFILKCKLRNLSFYYLNTPIACVESGGVSQVEQFKSINERYLSLSRNGMKTLKVSFFYNYLLFKLMIKKRLNFLLDKLF